MSEEKRADIALDADLARLRDALHEVRAPDGSDGALLAAYRARLAAHAREAARASAARVAPRVPLARRPHALVAVALATAVTALVALRVERAERSVPTGGAVDPTTAPSEPQSRAAAFRPLALARGVSAAESYSVVRVRIRLPTSAPGGASSDTAIEADLLLGEDGLARAIRFDEADMLFVSTGSEESGEAR